MRLSASAIVFVAIFSCCLQAAQPIFDVPRMDKILIDGKADDWGDGGFRVHRLLEPGGKPPARGSGASFRLGWNDQGLLLLVTVRDDKILEAGPGEMNRVYDLDSLEIFLAEQVGSSNFFQMFVSPGVDAQKLGVRSIFATKQVKVPSTDMKLTAASVKTPGGYVLEGLIPWQNLLLKPAEGKELAFQFYCNDFDGAGYKRHVIWFPRDNTHEDTSAMHRIRLAKRASRPVLAGACADYVRLAYVGGQVVADESEAGKVMQVRQGSKVLLEEKLVSAGGDAVAPIRLPLPSLEDDWTCLSVTIDGKEATFLSLQPLATFRKQALMDQDIVFDPYCFTGEAFPSCDFEKPMLMERLLGPYSIKTTFYDSNFKMVDKAGKVGRYGAIVEIQPKSGPIIRRYRTVCRIEADAEGAWYRPIKAGIEMPENLKIDPRATARQSKTIANWMKWTLFDRLNRDGECAAMLAHLYEYNGQEQPADYSDDYRAADRQYWVTLKRILGGQDKQFAKPVACPVKFDGPPAPVVREGTAKEAGMTEQAARKIDTVVEEWVKVSGQPCGVCVVRNGVIVLHKAYGRVGNQEMTLQTPLPMASITKLMSGTLMAMLLDQGLVRLDDRVEKYIPNIKKIRSDTPMAVHHLYTHTTGFLAHGRWDFMNDMEEVIVEQYPELPVGKVCEYNGVGYAVGGKVIEAVSGEALPQFYKQHLLGPLGCTGTDVGGTAGDAKSIPLDIAKIGQMLLNDGAYGNLRFYSAGTSTLRRPPAVPVEVPGGCKVVFGIGASFCGGPGLSKTTWGHGAASSAILRIDPENKLVIVMTRANAGRDYGVYCDRFIQAVTDNLRK